MDIVGAQSDHVKFAHTPQGGALERHAGARTFREAVVFVKHRQTPDQREA